MMQIEGILPAIVTPFDARGRFLPRTFEQLVNRLYSAGVHGMYVCGQTGEGLQQSVDQRKQVAEAAIALAPPGKHTVIHVGAANTFDAIELAGHAAREGATAISSLPPHGAYTFAEVKAYYQAVAAATALPLLVYYFPSLSPAIRSTEQILELCEIPNVVGLKFTDSDLFRLWEIRRSGAVVMNGSDEMLVAGLLMGANGGIGSIYNLIPEQFVELYECARDGRWADARRVQDGINELIAVVLRYPVHPAVKTLLRHTGIDCGDCVPPRRSLTAAEQKQLCNAIAQTALGGQLLPASAAR